MNKYAKLIKSLRCGGDEIPEEDDGLGCADKKCKYRDVDGACDLISMTQDAAAAIAALQAENAELRSQHRTERCEAAGYDCAEMGRLQAALSRVEAERDGYKRALYLAIETHSVDQRQIERLTRHYLEQVRGAPEEGERWRSKTIPAR